MSWQFTQNEWRGILWLAVVVSLGAYALMQWLVRHLTAVQVSSLSYLVPPTTLLQGYVLFGEQLSPIDLIALSLAVAAVYLMLVGKSAQTAMQQQDIPRDSRLANHHRARSARRAFAIDIEQS